MMDDEEKKEFAAMIAQMEAEAAVMGVTFEHYLDTLQAAAKADGCDVAFGLALVYAAHEEKAQHNKN